MIRNQLCPEVLTFCMLIGRLRIYRSRSLDSNSLPMITRFVHRKLLAVMVKGDCYQGTVAGNYLLILAGKQNGEWHKTACGAVDNT